MAKGGATQRFWETIIEPTFELLRPGTIVEIGSDTGANTENILGYCERSGATLHVVDPVPKYDVSAWKERYGDRLVFHKDLSLNALPLIGGFDAVLIDGDHNWYTVVNELRQVRERSEELSRPFPLVMLHDIGWPYGRRDLYYAPGTIPGEHRKPYEQKGLSPGSVGLLEKGGINPNLHNAVRENEPESGVLTAVEDFMEEAGEEGFELLRFPVFHGFGILVSPGLKERNGDLAAFLADLALPENIVRLMEQVEGDRIDALAELQKTRGRLQQVNERLVETSEQLRELRREMENMQNSRGWKIADKINAATLRLRGALRRG